MSTGQPSKQPFAKRDQTGGMTESLDRTDQPVQDFASRNRGPEDVWIANAESQVAMRRALMDCYNG
jgi:hypothetical protein